MMKTPKTLPIASYAPWKRIHVSSEMVRRGQAAREVSRAEVYLDEKVNFDLLRAVPIQETTLANTPEPKSATVTEILNFGRIVTTNDSERFYLHERFYSSRPEEGQQLAVVGTGVELTLYRSQAKIEVCCPWDFFPIAEKMLQDIRSRRTFTATDYLAGFAYGGREVPEGHDPKLFILKEPIDGEYSPTGITMLPDGYNYSSLQRQIVDGECRFRLGMEDLDSSLGPWDLIVAMAEKPLLAIPLQELP